MRRVLLFGGAWAAALAASLTIFLLPGRPVVKEVETRFTVPPPHAGDRHPGWTVTRAYSAHHMLVVEVRVDGTADTSSVAAQVVEPVADRYEEILIYVRDPDQAADDFPARRVQWTRRGGYATLEYRK
jgi:hypothetical protein